MQPTLRIAPRNVFGALLLTSIALTLLGIASAYGSIEIQRYYIFKVLFRLFYLNEEANVPAWFSSSLWLLAAVLSAILGLRGRRLSQPYSTHWVVLSLVFLALSADEAAAIHEAIGVFVESAYATSGYFAYGWVLVGIPFVVLFVLSFARFVLQLPPQIRNLMIVAGATYVAGALGLEMLAAANEKALTAFGYQLVVAAEEFAEMLGVVLLIYAMLTQIEITGGEIAFGVRALTAEERRAATASSHAGGKWPSRGLLVGVASVLAAVTLGVIGMLQLTAPVASSDQAASLPDVFSVEPEEATAFGDQNLSGQLGPGDRRLARDGTYVDVHVFEVPANALVSIWMQSSEFDPYLAVVRTDGTRVAQDDNPLPGKSYVEFVSSTSDKYSVLANAYSAEGAGAYELRFKTRELIPRQQ